ECQPVADSNEKATCNDNVINRVRETHQNPHAYETKERDIAVISRRQTPPAPVIRHSATAEDKFGRHGRLAREDRTIQDVEVPESIRSKITKVQRSNAFKRYMITLENGQVWRQMERKYLSIKTGQTVIIKRTFFAHFLETERGIQTKVQRIK
ncbi:MAG: hypothetical protein AAF512_11475, partial [Pseudomonadota bacterium]